MNLFDDILKHFQIGRYAPRSMAQAKVGEYIRTGLKYDEWLANMLGTD
jgi:hypothetical protein